MFDFLKHIFKSCLHALVRSLCHFVTMLSKRQMHRHSDFTSSLCMCHRVYVCASQFTLLVCFTRGILTQFCDNIVGRHSREQCRCLWQHNLTAAVSLCSKVCWDRVRCGCLLNCGCSLQFRQQHDFAGILQQMMAHSESLLAQPVVEAWQTPAATKALSYYALMQLVSAVKPIPCFHNHLLLLLWK